jgi:membrane protein DedA with SNARE-associated domain
MKKIAIFLLLLLSLTSIQAQNQDSLQVSQEKEKGILSKYTDNLNYYTITLLMTIESSFIPFPSEVIVPPAAYKACIEGEQLHVTNNKFVNVLFVILCATLGALLGACINYFLALGLGRPVLYWFVETKVGHLCMLNSKKLQTAEDYFIKKGNISTLIGRLIPAVRQLISIPAGLAKMKIPAFLFYTALGATIWNIILAILGYLASGQQELIEKYSHEFSIVILSAIAIGICYVVFKAFFKKKKNSDSANVAE